MRAGRRPGAIGSVGVPTVIGGAVIWNGRPGPGAEVGGRAPVATRTGGVGTGGNAGAPKRNGSRAAVAPVAGLGGKGKESDGSGTGVGPGADRVTAMARCRIRLASPVTSMLVSLNLAWISGDAPG